MQRRISSRGNPYHIPAGCPEGGQFTGKGGNSTNKVVNSNEYYKERTIERFKDSEPNKEGEIEINQYYSVKDGELVKKNLETKTTISENPIDQITKRGNIDLGIHEVGSLFDGEGDKVFLEKNMEKLNELDEKYNCSISIRKANLGKYTLGRIHFGKTIFLNRKITDNDYKETIKEQDEEKKDHWHSEGDSLTHTLTHEYGHSLEARIIKENNMEAKEVKQKISKIAKELLGKEKLEEIKEKYGHTYWGKEVKRATEQLNLVKERGENTEAQEKELQHRLEDYRLMNKKEYDWKKDANMSHAWAEYLKREFSRYGATNTKEFFAEAFTNLEGGKPNIIGKACGIFLKEIGF